MLSSWLDDKQNILSSRASMCSNNNVLCYFNKCDPLVRLKLIRSNCSDLYGSVSHSSIDNVCIAWRKGLGRALGLPCRTHSALLALVTGTLPLMDELLCRTAMFVSKCLTSDNSLVNFVARHGVYVLSQTHLLAEMRCGAV